MTGTRTVRALNHPQQEIRDRPEGNDIGAHSVDPWNPSRSLWQVGAASQSNRWTFPGAATPHTQSRAPADHGTLSRKCHPHQRGHRFRGGNGHKGLKERTLFRGQDPDSPAFVFTVRSPMERTTPAKRPR